jgi:hypothetical protein
MSPPNTVVHKGGAIRWLRRKGRMFFDPEGKPTRVVIHARCDRIAAREENCSDGAPAARLSASRMGTLAGGIAHDFNNLLGVTWATASGDAYAEADCVVTWIAS